jgi:hypothetical protein
VIGKAGAAMNTLPGTKINVTSYPLRACPVHDAATYILFPSGKNRVKNLNPKFEGGHYAAKL